MAHGYVYETRPTQTNQNEPRKVFVTGAGGRIGSEFARRMKDRYDLTLMVHPDKDPGRVEGCGRIVRATLENRDELTSLFKNHDAVVHLAANPAPDAGWQSVLDNNIRGTYHAMAAADAAGCRRLVYASSVHAVAALPFGAQAKTDGPVSPTSLYGVSKCFGEALGRYFATRHELSVIAIRIGGFQPVEAADDPRKQHMQGGLVSHRDLCHLIACAVENKTLRFAIAHGVSRGQFAYMDPHETRDLLGYEPQDDFTPSQDRK